MVCFRTFQCGIRAGSAGSSHFNVDSSARTAINCQVEAADACIEYIDIPEPEHIIIEDNFSSVDCELTKDLRDHFDERFADPLRTTADRFCWDWWNVPGQYNLLRTPADAYFPAALYDRLENALTEYGERVLGCRGISPVWLSYYVDGCRQELHTDSPHGPWAFVLSLTRWETRQFTGGETMILQPHVLDFWRGFDQQRGWEATQLQTLVEPHFGRFTVFDPRFPHGVRAVQGTRDPCGARIVLHGWFTAPTPFFTGPLPEEASTPVLNAGLDVLYASLAELPPAVGTTTVRVHVNGFDGTVRDVEFLTNTVMPRPQGTDDPDETRGSILGCIAENLYNLQFEVDEKGESGDSSIVLPFIFE